MCAAREEWTEILNVDIFWTGQNMCWSFVGRTKCGSSVQMTECGFFIGNNNVGAL